MHACVWPKVFILIESSSNLLRVCIFVLMCVTESPNLSKAILFNGRGIFAKFVEQNVGGVFVCMRNYHVHLYICHCKVVFWLLRVGYIDQGGNELLDLLRMNNC